MIKDCNFIELKLCVNNSGKLVATNNSIPFEPQNLFYIYDIKGPRGGHAHKKAKQFLICILGDLCITLNDGFMKTTYHICEPSCGLYISNMVWVNLHDFSNNCICLVLSSEHYDENDYIREWDHFMREIC